MQGQGESDILKLMKSTRHEDFNLQLMEFFAATDTPPAIIDTFSFRALLISAMSVSDYTLPSRKDFGLKGGSLGPIITEAIAVGRRERLDASWCKRLWWYINVRRGKKF